MSEENVQIVRRLVDAWNRHDIEGVLALTDPEAEYVNAPTAVEPGIRRGHDEFVVVLRKQWEVSGGVQEVDRFHDRGEEIVTEGSVSRTMPGSDRRLRNPILMSWKFQDGKLIRIEQLGAGPGLPAALEAAGLSE